MKELNTEGPLVNRVAKSPLTTINLEEYYPQQDIVELDISQYLFKGLLLKEKDFRKTIKNADWSTYDGKIVCVFCSTDAIVPVWAYMLISTYLHPHAEDVYHGTREDFLKQYYSAVIRQKDWSTHQDGLYVIKGCSEKPVPSSAYMDLTRALQPYARSIMYGEACSTVPIYKRPKKS